MAADKINKIRLFIGTRAEFPIIKDEYINKLCEHFPCPIKIIEKSNIHLTWKFIGEIDAKKLDKIQSSVEEILIKISDVNINFDKFEIWPSGKRPSLIVLTGRDLNGNATKLHRKLDKKFEKLKIAREKRNFIPHITVARFKIKQKPAEQFILPDWLMFNSTDVIFSDISIFQCNSTKNGSVYTPIKTFII